MQNKKLLYILIPAVIIIWGLIMWKIFDFTGDSQANTLPAYQETSADSSMIKNYSLSLSYHDPFMKTNSMSKIIATQKRNNIRELEINRLTQRTIPPNLMYYGFILCGPDHIALLELNDRKLLLKKNEAFEEIKVLRFDSDTIWFSYQEKTFSYGKND